MKKNVNTTLEMLAEKLGLSKGTVSLALNGKPGVSSQTRDLVLKCAAEMNYKGYAVRQSTRQVAVLLPRLTSSFNSEILAGIERAAGELDYDLIVHTIEGKSFKYEPFIQRIKDRVDGLITSTGLLTEKTRELLGEVGAPIVCLAPEKRGDASVSVNHRKSCEQVIHHLFELGHREIAYCHGISRYSELRLGYSRDAAAELGMKLLTCSTESELEPEIAYYNFSKFMAEGHKFTAVVCASDFIAGGVLQLLNDSGLRVPHDVSLVGFDGLSWTKLLTPPLTTVQQPLSEQGEAAMHLLVDLIKGRGADHYILDSTLIIRNSTAKVKS
jgi:DNA-binding LacI/PurR family transcriptional regulator